MRISDEVQRDVVKALTILYWETRSLTIEDEQLLNRIFTAIWDYVGDEAYASFLSDSKPGAVMR